MAAYSFDSSAFIEPLRRHHKRKVFPALWAKIDALIKDGSIVATEFVKTELSKKDDEIFGYVKTMDGLFVPFDGDQKPHLDQIMNRFPKWIPPDSTKNVGDPFVIALAKQCNLTVVTYEQNGTATDVRIPFACKEFGVSCLHFVAFLEQIGYLG